MMLNFGVPEAAVTAVGIALAILVLRYFLGSAKRPVTGSARSAGGVQEIEVLVKGGYTPDTLVLEQGVPARLIVRREEEGECSEELIIADLRVKAFLPPRETTTITFTPDRAGTFRMTCGMGMLHGTVVVKPR